MVRHLLRAAAGSTLLVVCLISLPAQAFAQAGLGGLGVGGAGILNDPFTFYYAVYLPNQQLQAMRPSPNDSIDSAMATRQYYAQADRQGLYNPISPYADQNYDPLHPYSRQQGTERTARPYRYAQSVKPGWQRPVPLLWSSCPVLSWPQAREGKKRQCLHQRRRFSTERQLHGSWCWWWRYGWWYGWWHGWNGRRHGWHGRHDVSHGRSRRIDPRNATTLHLRGALDVASRPDQLRLTPDERADLVAYVDGELPEGHAQIIATKLTKSATARREVEMLQKTWEMLDHLALPRVAEHFSEKTVSHIRRLEVQGRSWEPILAAWSARVGRLAVYLLLASMFLGLGYSLARWVWPDKTERLVHDLTLADHLDEYLEIGSFEFLSQLAESPEFGPAIR